MTYLLTYLLVGILLAEVTNWNDRRKPRQTFNRIQYTMCVLIWPLVLLAALLKRR